MPRIKPTDEYLNLISNNLRRLMLAKNINQTELALAINVHKATVSDWLKCKIAPSASTIKKLADYFGVSPAEIISPQSESRTQSHLSKEAQEIIANLEQMNEMGQKKVLDFSCDMVKIYPR